MKKKNNYQPSTRLYLTPPLKGIKFGGFNLISCVDQIKYDLEELPVHGELVNRLHMSKVPYRKRREEGITGPLEVVLCQYKPYP